jgi:hypothetical protein
MAAAALCRQTLEVGAVCPNWARTDLCGGRLATAVPTANDGPSRRCGQHRAVVRKPPRKEPAVGCAAGLSYRGLDRLHNFEVTERILLKEIWGFTSFFTSTSSAQQKYHTNNLCVISRLGHGDHPVSDCISSSGPPDGFIYGEPRRDPRTSCPPIYTSQWACAVIGRRVFTYKPRFRRYANHATIATFVVVLDLQREPAVRFRHRNLPPKSTAWAQRLPRERVRSLALFVHLLMR